MTHLNKQNDSKNNIRKLIVDQLIIADPASLSMDIISKGLGCAMDTFCEKEVLTVLDEMVTDYSITKTIDAECGARFKLVACPGKSYFAQEDC